MKPSRGLLAPLVWLLGASLGAPANADVTSSAPSVPVAGRSPVAAPNPAAPNPAAQTRQGASDVAAQLREAGDRYERAFQLYDEGAHDAALSELKRAYELAPSFRILYNLGVMSLGVHDTAGAMDYLERYLAEGGAAISSDVRAQIGEELSNLAERVALVEIDVNVRGAEVSVDDRVIGVAPLARVARVNVGTRRISARASGWLPDATQLSLAGGDERRVVLTLSNPRSIAPVPVAETPEHGVPWLGFGATAVLAAGSIFSGVEALAAQNDFDRKRRTLGVSSAELEDADAQAFRWSVAADVLAVAALATGGYSLYLTFAAPDAEPVGAARGEALRVDLTASGVLLRGGF